MQKAYKGIVCMHRGNCPSIAHQSDLDLTPFTGLEPAVFSLGG